tara:strand:+ start:615 stop:848 length:234 start_codon:yes stop_codon:yes gene_type:complete
LKKQYRKIHLLNGAIIGSYLATSDISLFNIYYNSHSPYILNKYLSFSKNKLEAEDLSLAVFLKSILNLSQKYIQKIA